MIAVVIAGELTRFRSLNFVSVRLLGVIQLNEGIV